MKIKLMIRPMCTVPDDLPEAGLGLIYMEIL